MKLKLLLKVMLCWLCVSTCFVAMVLGQDPTEAPTAVPTVVPTTQPTFNPTFNPTFSPTQSPTFHPTPRPTRFPSAIPTAVPTYGPTAVPTLIPTAIPTFEPTHVPSAVPTMIPTFSPTFNPTFQPSAVPTKHPTAVPSFKPSSTPTEVPTIIPTQIPTMIPTFVPSAVPTFIPTAMPTDIPTIIPSAVPSEVPTAEPTFTPSASPTFEPTIMPTFVPTTTAPSATPTHLPSSRPSGQPSSSPTARPSSLPSSRPSGGPTSRPSNRPSSLPSGAPTNCPSGEPSSRPTRNPTTKPSIIPTGHPSSQPSNVPSSKPSCIPTSHPSARPSNQPSSSPSCMPTSHPSAEPSAQPVSQPTAPPNTEPSAQPTSQPSSIPSLQPFGKPSSFPSSVPSSQPSSVPTTSKPTNQPTSLPTNQPTASPSIDPTSQPSASPTVQPSISPSAYPSAIPTSFPSTEPSTHPTTFPSESPSSFPTSHPSSQPSSSPSAWPTSLPSGLPSTQPTDQPSAQPTSIPSRQPTSFPTSKPSSVPTGQPTSIPSSHPSTQPSCQPSSQPSGQPSFQPTSHPTTRDTPRYFSCETAVPCEVNQHQFCEFTTGFIYLMCKNSTAPCTIDTNNFSIGPQTYFEVVGGCPLIVKATGQVIIYSNTTVKAASVHLNSGKSMKISGEIITDGGGPLQGPGSPASSSKAYYSVSGSTPTSLGGSYGGSGGKNEECDTSYFSLTDGQIGHVSVLPDIYLPSTVNPTFGSGGGVAGSGLGGGRIILNVTSNLLLATTSVLSASGTNSSVAGGGGGSGGSILILANYFLNEGGSIRANGGKAMGQQGAGGGGRVSVMINSTQSLSSLFTNLTTVNMDGGAQVLGNNVLVGTCNVGAAGTLYIQNGGLNPEHHSKKSKSFVISMNKENQPFAGTILNEIPHSTVKVLAQNYSTIMTAGISLKFLSTCEKFSANTMDERCSGLQIHEYSNLICYNQTTNNNATVYLNDSTACAVMADVVTIRGYSEMTVSPNVEKIYSYSSYFFLAEDSEFHYSGSAVINTTYNATLYGLVRLSHHAQSYSFNTNPKVVISSSNSVILNQVMADKLYVHGRTIRLEERGQLRPYGNDTTTCVSNLLSNISACGDFNFTTVATTVALRASEEIVTLGDSIVHSSTVFMCAPNVTIGSSAYIRTDGLGCPANAGLGPGEQSPGGSGGGGYGGAGGRGAGIGANGGSPYYKDYQLSSGSGGGCSNTLPSGSCYLNGVGGGIISIEARKQLILYGNITSNGKNGNLTAGGGAGGSVSIFAGAFSGIGYILALGGTGGVGSVTTGAGNVGGGGGGGYIEIFNQFNSDGNYNSYTFQGPILATGGAAGGPQATSGQKGKIELPNCSPGYGNNPSVGAICTICPAGTYSTGTNGPCLPCNNAPHHSFYTDEGVETSDCPYACENGYSTTQCYNQFQKFIYNTLGLGGVAGCAIAIITIILIPMLYFRFKKKYGWGEKTKDTTDFFKRAILFDMGLGDDLRMNKNDSRHGEHDTENPIHSNSFSVTEDVISVKIRSLAMKVGDDLRREHRMADQDMIFHACRVNLSGTNHPSYYKGGPWRMSTVRPNCLRPMLHRKEFQELAEAINKLVSWDQFGYEMMVFYLVFFFVPPLSALVMRALRHKRTNLLLKFIANYDYKCFRCPEQRRKRNSLRIGISPDSTLAYIDFLFDEEHFNKEARPLCRLGQTKLPASFRFAGLGTYFSPYFVDTNDLVLQAVPQTDVTSAFIDEAWISFVVEFNTILRTIHHDSLYQGVRSIIKFLSDEKHTNQLGGLIVEFCTFENFVRLDQYQSTKDLQDDDSVISSDVTSNNSVSAKSKSSSQTDRDSFVEASRLEKGFRQTSVADNWFLNLGDVVLGSRKRVDPNKNRERMYEMRSTESGSRRGDAASQRTEEEEEEEISRPTDVPAERPSTASSTASSFSLSCTSCYRCFVNIWRSFKRGLYNLLFGEPNAAVNMHQLNFVETVRAIESGKLNMGIVVSHPKIFEDVYIVTDEDYPDEEDDDIDDKGSETSDSVHASDNEETPKAKRITSRRIKSRDFRKRDPNSKSSESISSMEKAYGSKAEEISKFYKIMQAAEQNMNGDTPLSIEKTPSMELSSSYNSTKSATVARSISNSGGISPVKISNSPFVKMENIYKEEEVPTYDRNTEDEGPFARTLSTTSIVSLSDEIKRQSRLKAAAAAAFENNNDEYVEFNRNEFATSRPASNKFTLHSLGRGSVFNADDRSSLSGSEEGDYEPNLEGDDFMHDDSNHDDRGSNSDEDDAPPSIPLPPSRLQSADRTYSSQPSVDNPNTRIAQSLTRDIVPVTPDSMYPPVNIQGKKSPKRKKKKKVFRSRSIILNHNLAPSCYQQSVRTWRIQEDYIDPTSDGKLGPLHARNGVTEDAARKLEGTAENALHGNNNVITDDDIEARKSDFIRPSERDESMVGGGARDSMTRMRDSMFPIHLLRISFGSKHANQTNDDTQSAISKEDTANSRSKIGVLNPAAMFSNLMERSEKSNSPWSRITRFVTYMINNRFFLFQFREFMLGGNSYPYGPKYLRQLFELVIVLLCMSDITLWIIILFNTYCASDNATACTNHNALYLVVTVWPLAFFIAPLMGIAAILLGPSATLSRVYALFSRLAAINNGIMIFIMVKYINYFYNNHVTGSIYTIIAVTCSRFFQCFFVDVYIAHIERLRYTRGWDGLSTSLFKTKDNKNEVLG